MILLNHGVVSTIQTPSVEIIQSVVARTNVVSTFTKSVTINFLIPQQKDEVLLFFLYQDHSNTTVGGSIPENLITVANTSVNSISYHGNAKYAVYKREYLLSESINVEDASFTFSYFDAMTPGLLTVRGYRLINADYNNITLATRPLLTNTASITIPSSPLNVSAGDATFVQHMMSEDTVTSISDVYENAQSMFTSSTVYRARSWHKIHTIDDTSHNAQVTWSSFISANSTGFMVHVPHI